MFKKVKEQKVSILITSGIILIAIFAILFNVFNIYARNNVFAIIVFSPLILIIGLFIYSQKIKKENATLNYILKFVCFIAFGGFIGVILSAII